MGYAQEMKGRLAVLVFLLLDQLVSLKKIPIGLPVGRSLRSVHLQYPVVVRFSSEAWERLVSCPWERVAS